VIYWELAATVTVAVMVGGNRRLWEFGQEAVVNNSVTLYLAVTLVSHERAHGEMCTTSVHKVRLYFA